MPTPTPDTPADEVPQSTGLVEGLAVAPYMDDLIDADGWIRVDTFTESPEQPSEAATQECAW